MDEAVTKSKMSERRFLKKAAAKLLFSDWLTQILMFLIVGSVFYGIWQFGITLGLFVNQFTSNEKLAKLIISVFGLFALAIFVPLTYGLLTFEVNFISNKKSTPSDVFCAFSSSRAFFRSTDLFLGLMFRNLLYFSPALLLFCFNTMLYPFCFSRYFYFAGIDVVLFLLRTLFVILVYVGITLSYSGFVASYIAVKTDKEIAECFFEAGMCIRKNRSQITKLFISFFPLVVVSLFTVGFLFVMYTIPYMFITLTMFSKYLYDKRVYEKVNQNQHVSININEFCE